MEQRDNSRVGYEDLTKEFRQWIRGPWPPTQEAGESLRRRQQMRTDHVALPAGREVLQSRIHCNGGRDGLLEGRKPFIGLDYRFRIVGRINWSFTICLKVFVVVCIALFVGVSWWFWPQKASAPWMAQSGRISGAASTGADPEFKVEVDMAGITSRFRQAFSALTQSLSASPSSNTKRSQVTPYGSLLLSLGLYANYLPKLQPAADLRPHADDQEHNARTRMHSHLQNILDATALHLIATARIEDAAHARRDTLCFANTICACHPGMDSHCGIGRHCSSKMRAGSSSKMREESSSKNSAALCEPCPAFCEATSWQIMAQEDAVIAALVGMHVVLEGDPTAVLPRRSNGVTVRKAIDALRERYVTIETTRASALAQVVLKCPIHLATASDRELNLVRQLCEGEEWKDIARLEY